MQAQDCSIANRRPPADVDSAACAFSRLQLHPHGSTADATLSLAQQLPQQQQGTEQQHIPGWDELPQPLLVQVLGYVSLSDRLCWCARVCRSWSEAAAAATDSIGIFSQLSKEQRGRLMHWLCKHRALVSKLQVWLPDSNKHFFRQLASCGTQLTSLSLTSCEVFLHIVPELSALQNLQQLELTDTQGAAVGSYLPQHCAAFLQQSTALTHLKLAGSFSEYLGRSTPCRQSLQCVWTLTQLRAVKIQGSGTRPLLPSSFQGLSGMTQLTSFTLRAPWLSVTSGESAIQDSVPGLSRLTQLHVLKLHGRPPIYASRLQPSALSGFKTLQHLALGFESLEPAATGAQDLLELLPQLQQLTALQLHVGSALEACKLTCLSALTASSQLKCLDLNCVRLPREGDTAPPAEPRSPWKHVFAVGGARLSQLQGLSLLYVDPDLQLSDFERIVCSCPKLDTLAVQDLDSLSSDAYMVPLLSKLTKLHVAHVNDRVVWCSGAGAVWFG